MQNLKEVRKVLSSWKKYEEKGTLNSNSEPAYVNESTLESLLNFNKLFISVFNKSVKEIKKNMPNIIFLLADANGVLISKSGLSDVWLKNGISLAEKDCGTNAISMCLSMNEPVFMPPEYHYCKIFKSWNCYAVPILNNKNCCLAAVSINKNLPGYAFAVTDLLRYKIEKEVLWYLQKEKKNTGGFELQPRISEKQKSILRYIAQAHTDNSISIELGLSLNTVKYHKKELFRKLNARTNVEAVVKALKSNVISLDEFE